MDYSEEQYLKRIGERIVEIRKSRSMTQLDLAVKSGIEERSIQRMESEKPNPTAKSLIRITRALNISMSEFFHFDI